MSSNTATTTSPTTSASPCDPANMPKPTKEHEWLQRFVGEWQSDVEMYMEPGKPPMKTSGTCRDRLIGGFWLTEQGGNPDMPFEYLLTVGYDPKRGKYVGTWTDSMSSYHWHYVGTVNPEGTTLTFETEGPTPWTPDKRSKFRDVTEFKGKDLRVFTSSVQGDDGKWTKMISVTSRRTK